MNNKIVEYKSGYASDLLRGQNLTSCPWIVQEVINNYAGYDKRLLDVGCGTSYKIIPVCSDFEYVLGVDPSPDMLQQSKINIKDNNIKNMHLIKSVAEGLPFSPRSFDVVTAFLTRVIPSEIHRVLKPNGIAIVEVLSILDKQEFTRYFGKDNQGYRGVNLGTFSNIEHHQLEDEIATLKSMFSPYFKQIEIFHGTWQTTYTSEGLWELLKNTQKTVRGFCEEKDKKYFDQAMNDLKKGNAIVLNQSRYLIIAKDKI